MGDLVEMMFQIGKWRLYCNTFGKDLLPKEKKGLPSKKKKTAANNVPDVSLRWNSLLDTGRNQDALTGAERIFYQDQCGPKEHRLSEEIDWDFELKRHADQMEIRMQIQHLLKQLNTTKTCL